MCFSVGFAMGYNRVICFHRQSRKFIISRHVIHEEALFPYKNVDLTKAQVSRNTHTSRIIWFSNCNEYSSTKYAQRGTNSICE